MLVAGINRTQLLAVLPKGGKVAEVGVFQGAYSAHIMRAVEPSELHLIDPWACEGNLNPQYTTASMEAALEQVRGKFQDDIADGRVVLHREYSIEAAKKFSDHCFDWIYVDALHDYTNVLADLRAFKQKVKPDGFILGHDFSNYRNPRLFGVIPAVREFLRTDGFELVLITNELNPSYLLARAGNDSTLPTLKQALLSHRGFSAVELAESLLDQFTQVEVTYADGRKGRLPRFG